MASVPPSNLNILHIDNKCFNNNVHKINWRKSISQQLQLRNTIEQNQFQDICSFAGNMFDRINICKSENVQLNLKCENLQQQLLGIQQTLLAGGSAAAKTVLNKLSLTIDQDGSLVQNPSAPTTTLTVNDHSSLLAEKNQLEKKILDLQEKLTEVHKNRSDTAQKVIDLKTEVEEKDKLNRKLNINIESREREIIELRKALSEHDQKFRTLDDEHTSLTLAYNCLERQYKILKDEYEAMKTMMLAIKREDAERLNAENEKIMALQDEKQRLKIEANVNEMTAIQLAKQAAGDPTALRVAAMARALDNFELVDDPIMMPNFSYSRVPQSALFTFDAHDGGAFAVNWYFCAGPKDAFLATGGEDRKLKIWKINHDTSALKATLIGSNASITSIDVESDFILASSNDYSTRLYSMNDYKSKQTLTGHSSKVLAAKFLGNVNRVVSGSHDRTIKIWDVNQGTCTKTYFAGSTCHDVVYNNDHVISGHFDSKIRCWALNQPDNKEPVTQIALQSKITSLDVSSDGLKILCSVRDNSIKLLDIRKMEVIQTYFDERFKIGADNTRAKFSVDGKYIACGSQDGSILIWNTNTTKIEKVLLGHTNAVVATCWSPDGEKMVSIERGRKVTIWA